MCMVVHVLQDMDKYAPWALECQSRPLYTAGTTKRDKQNLKFMTRSKNTACCCMYSLELLMMDQKTI